MITLILCLRPLRVPKFVWFKILRDRRYEFGAEMTAGEDCETVFIGACTAGNLPLARATFDRTYPKISKAVMGAFKTGKKELIDFIIDSRIQRHIVLYNAARLNDECILKRIGNIGEEHEYYLFWGACRGSQNKILQNMKPASVYLPHACKSGSIEMVLYIMNGCKILGSDFVDALDIVCKKNYLHILKIFTNHLVKWNCGSVVYKYVGQESYALMAPFIENELMTINTCMFRASAVNRIDLIEYFLGKGANNYKECLEVSASACSVDAILFWASKSILISESHLIFLCLNQKIEMLKKIIHLINIDNLLKMVYFNENVDDRVIEYLLSCGAKKPIY